MDENILERIVDFYVNLDAFEWNDYLTGKPDGYDDLPFKEKVPYVANILYKLDILLNDPVEILKNWSWHHKHLGRTFDEFLSYQLSKIQDRPLPHKTFKEYFKRNKQR